MIYQFLQTASEIINQLQNAFEPVALLNGFLAVGFFGAGFILLVQSYRDDYIKRNLLTGITVLLLFSTSILFFLEFIYTGAINTGIYIVGSIIGVLLVLFILMQLGSRKIWGLRHALRAAEKRLAEQEYWMQLMQENMNDGLALFSPEGKLHYINPAAIKILGLKKISINKHNAAVFEHPFKSERSRLKEIKAKVLNNESISVKVNVSVKKENKLLEINFSPVQDKIGHLIGILVSYKDVTQTYALEQAKKEFIQIASHELRTPLTAIRGYVSLMQMKKYGDLSEKQQNFLQRASYAAGRLAKLVDNLLLVARIEDSRITLNRQMVNLENLTKTVISEIEGEARRRSIGLSTNFDSKINSIYADKEKLRLILTNLVSNAVKYTPDGGKVKVEMSSKNGQIYINVIDTGIGISKKDQNKLFQKFERVNSKRSVRVGGSGLGLVIVKSFTELHGGKINVKSKEGKGSCFTVTLPIVDQSVEGSFTTIN